MIEINGQSHKGDFTDIFERAQTRGYLSFTNDNYIGVSRPFTPEEIVLLDELTRPYVAASRFETNLRTSVSSSAFTGTDTNGDSEKAIFALCKLPKAGQQFPEYDLNIFRNGSSWDDVNFRSILNTFRLNLETMYPGVVQAPKEIDLPARQKIVVPRFSLVS